MICSLNHIVINCAANGYGFLATTDRAGHELKILKEKDTDETYRTYHCTCCGEKWEGDMEGWIAVTEHFGKQVKQWHEVNSDEIIDLNDIDLDDPNLRPTLKAQLKPIIEVFGSDNS